MLSVQGKEARLDFANVLDEVARRLKQPNPDPQVITMAWQDLEQYARDLRAFNSDTQD